MYTHTGLNLQQYQADAAHMMIAMLATVQNIYEILITKLWLIYTMPAGGKVTGNLTGLLSDDDSSDHSIIDDTGSESTHISEGITDDGQLFEDTGIGADLSDVSDAASDDQSDVSNF